MIGLLLLAFLAVDDGSADDGAVDQQVRLSLRPGAIQVDYRVQLGRQAAFAEVLQMDRDRDGKLSADEQAEYFAALEKTILAGLELRVDGRDLALRRVGELRLEMPFRKIYRFEAACPDSGRLEFHNENFPDTPGAASIVVDGTPTSALQRDLVGELRPGAGLVERGRSPERLAAPSAAGGLTLRLLALGGFLGGALLAFRRRRGAAVLSGVAALACGAAALVATRPSTSEAERIFRALHEDAARAADPSLRRVKPLETRIAPIFDGSSGFDVRHRWAAYGSLAHSGHAHAGVTEREGRFRVRWDGSAWRLEDLDAKTTSEPGAPIASGSR